MSNHNPMVPAVPAPRWTTTLLAAGWGLTSAYLLLNSLLVTHDMRPCLAALVPLVIVWATLERKRWGRLALQGLSATALGLFVSAVGLAYAIGSHTLPTEQKTLPHFIHIALGIFGEKNSTSAIIVLCLAALTVVYLRRPSVIAEFERGKQKTLAVAQRAIAMTLVGFWGIAVAGGTLPKSAPKAESNHHAASVKSRAARSHTSSKRTERSAAPANSL